MIGKAYQLPVAQSYLHVTADMHDRALVSALL